MFAESSPMIVQQSTRSFAQWSWPLSLSRLLSSFYSFVVHKLSKWNSLSSFKYTLCKACVPYNHNLCERAVMWFPVSWSHPFERGVGELDKKDSKVKWLHSRQMVKMTGKSPCSEIRLRTWQLLLQKKNKNSIQSSSLPFVTIHIIIATCSSEIMMHFPGLQD